MKVTPTSKSTLFKRQALSPLQAFIFLLVICGLTFSLATRTFRLQVHQTTTLQSAVSHATRQHLDRDAITWTAPSRERSFLHELPVAASLHDWNPQLPTSIFAECLYNRPPPNF